MNRILFIALLLLAFHCVCKAQSIDSLKAQYNLENYLETLEESYDLEDDLKFLRTNPIYLLTADKDDLLKLPFVDQEMVGKIITALDNNIIKSKRDLKLIINNNEIYESIIPFITFKAPRKNIGFSILSALSSEMQNRRGFDSTFEGGKIKSLTKMSLKYLPYNLSAGFTIEKDPGEKFFTDHYSGFIKYETNEFKIISGDYRVSFIEGLTFGNQTFIYNKENISGITQGKRTGLRTFNGTSETDFLRGLSLEYRLNKTGLIAFYSNRFIDANINGEGLVTSFYNGGLHRYGTEISKKGTLNEKIYGGQISRSLGSHLLSLNIYSCSYNRDFLGSGYYGLRGSSFSAIGIGYNYYSEQIDISAEAAGSGNNSFAGILNVGFNINKETVLFVNARKYPFDYSNPFANSISVKGNTQNEEGFSVGIKISPLPNTEINSYVEIFRQPYRTYYNPLPSKGMEMMIKAQISINRNHLLSLRYRLKEGDEPLTIDDAVKGETKAITVRNKKEIRLEYNSLYFGNLYLKSRIELSLLDYKLYREDETGFIIFQDFLYKPFDNLSLSSRAMLFSTSSYETALYEYEREITGIYSVNALSDKGARFYFTFNYSWGDIFSLMFKFSSTTYNNKNSIGSSYDQLKGKSLSKISFEFGVKL